MGKGDPKPLESPLIVKHDMFYFTNVSFLVEQTLYSIPRLVLERSSEVFQDMFRLPVGGDLKSEGSSDDNPIVLEGVSSYDFNQLLKVLCCRLAEGNPDEPEGLPRTLQEWTAVLGLAHKWSMDSVQRFTIKRMNSLNMDPVDKVRLALKYEVKEWLVPALNDLVKRGEPMCAADVDKLGLDVVLKLSALREGAKNTIRTCNNCGYNHGSNNNNSDFTQEIRRSFQEYLS